jgi:hypothetical protein
MIDIDAMTSDEWLNYREDLLEQYYAEGHKLIPNHECSSCDPDEDYTCFACEVFQVSKWQDEKEAV